MLITCILVCIGCWSVDQFEHFKKIEPDTWGVYYSVIGVIFAMIAGLMLVQELERYSDLKLLFQEELNALQDIRDYLIFFDDVSLTEKDKIKESLDDYVKSVITKDWEHMKNQEMKFSDTSPELYKIMHCVDDVEVKNKSVEIALEGIMSQIFSITTLRTKRFFIAKEQSHKSVFLLIALMAVIIVMGMMMMNINSLVLHIFMVNTTYISMATLVLILKDLNNPFDGVWKINLEGFEYFLQHKRG